MIEKEHIEAVCLRNPFLRVCESLKDNELPWALLTDDQKAMVRYVWDNTVWSLKTLMMERGRCVHMNAKNRWRALDGSFKPREESVFFIEKDYYPFRFFTNTYPYSIRHIEDKGYMFTGEFRRPNFGEYVMTQHPEKGLFIQPVKLGWPMHELFWILKKKEAENV